MPNGHFSIRNLTTVPSMPSAESVGKAAKSWVAMAGWTEKDPCGSAGPRKCHNTGKFVTAWAGSALPRTGLSPLHPLAAPPAHLAVPSLSSSTGQGTQGGENNGEKTEKIPCQLLP